MPRSSVRDADMRRSRPLVISADEIRARIQADFQRGGKAALVDEDCPGISVHPAAPLPKHEELTWCTRPRGPYRVREHTCLCQPVHYELISCGGIYMFHRVIGVDRPKHSYAGGWRVAEARLWWRRLLAGQVC
ncbi:hypothetical protein JOL79_16435 [Microbispora sp. RL4-1S]|uniref:Uncharacterized protein n=1 Tax=Microbispora oryzae TaxID=2806554 RepID=A0A941AR12_9ACTN|nr:hypothetical protein [Microbispora oryzae]MBP2705404.1 hypothetical protein [Microbispora oryzae]